MNEASMLTGLAAFLVTYLVHSSVMLGGAWALCRWRTPSSAWRETLWRTAILAPVLTAAISLNHSVTPLAGQWQLHAGAPETVAGAVSTPATLEETGKRRGDTGRAIPADVTSPGSGKPVRDPVEAGPALVREADASRTSAMEVPAWRGVLELLPAAWLLLAAVLSLRWVFAALAGRRLIADRRPLDSGPANEALARLATAHGRAAPPLSVSRCLGGAATLPSGEICLPQWALSLPADELRAMLAHEYAHVVRRDPWWLSLAICLEAVFWLQPLNRVARREIAHLAELHADAQAAGWTNDGYALARCLASCAERVHAGRMPVLAAAMAGQGGALSERVRKLVTGSIESGGLKMSRKTMIFLGAIALAVVLPSVAVLANKAAGRGGPSTSGTHVSVHQETDSPANMNISVSDDKSSLKLRAQGDVVFAADDSGIEEMGNGATLELEKTAGGDTRRLTAKGTGNGIDYHFYVNGKERPWNDDARAWLAGVMPEIMRESAINAPERVDYILAHQGHDGVLEEIEKIRGDYARRRYIEAYSATGKLPPDAYERLVGEAAKIGSDYELGKALLVIHGSQAPRGDALARLINAADGIDSDFEMRRLLAELASDELQDKAVAAAYAKAAESIGSDFELRQTLSALVEKGGNADAVALALPLAANIGSDFQLRQFLESAAPIAAGNEDLGIQWLKAAKDIGSDFELRKALDDFAARRPASPRVWAAMFDTAGGIDSDHECAEFLAGAAGNMPDDPAVRQAFTKALNTIGSESEHQRVARAAGEI